MKLKSPITVRQAETAEDLQAIRQLFQAYVDWLDIDLSYQGFEAELAGLPGKYSPPGGALLLAKDPAGQVCGCVGLRPFETGSSCEMKRLYVLPEARGLGVGALLVERVIHAAVLGGYKTMLLDTLPTMTGAIRLYENAGFRETAAYYPTPIKETVFFSKDL
ncbi:GNAT family N-acetyltransferase [Roseibium denhamense]|uniref:Acetyltransferase (GNAT) family protein n=1 Tax=Roseibium denhamense TaxID=76305 RepID=A0ABY1N5X6_9HYPH|nr:GNAT family N-acetyltransferase [Roseibium denhamense]MTI06108.1 GNAT family N-acetyltransferase [Roseibium denhamense]SMP01132.1 Acetyltransferase (GNAT) family protein [Roseibium denhamense]